MGIYTTKTAWQRALRPVVVFCVYDTAFIPDVFTYGALAVSMQAS